MAANNNLANIVETIASEQKSKYDTEVLVESQFYSDFPYKVLSYLEKNYQNVFQSFMKHIVPDNSGKIDYLIYVYDSMRIPRLFLSVDIYPTLTGKDSTRWVTEKTFLIDGKEYYISNQWVGHETEEKKNLRINDFAMAIYQDSGYRFFVDFVKKNTSKSFSRLLMVKSSNNANNSYSDSSFMINQVVSVILSTGLIYSPTLIKRLAYSLMAKPFVILSGLAGSGKTQLALAFAKCLSENIEEQVCTVSIGADWTNREPLLGYPNALNKDEYVKPESGVLQLLMRANEDPDKPYFLILDEMNLSVVERYFADFLSAMESGEKIKLWDNAAGNVPKEIELPKNVFIIGTINVDETTYMFSPKVLDRANVIEFKIAPDEMEQYLNEKKDIHLEKAYSACSDMAEDFVNKAKSQIQIDNNDEKTVLLSFFTELKKVNAEFGYRTVNEISRYLHFADGDLEDDSAIDTAILQKLLPKLHGSAKKLKKVLEPMWKLCLNDGVTKEIDAEFSATDFKYPESAEKIQRMYKAVVDNGFTSFAEA